MEDVFVEDSLAVFAAAFPCISSQKQWGIPVPLRHSSKRRTYTEQLALEERGHQPGSASAWQMQQGWSETWKPGMRTSGITMTSPKAAVGCCRDGGS